MHRVAWLALLAGCAFNPAAVDGADAGAAPGDDAAPTAAACRESGTVLCLDFERDVDPMQRALDGSGHHHDAEVSDVTLEDADEAAPGAIDARAVRLGPTSRLVVAPAPALELTRFTFEARVVRRFEAPPRTRYWLIDHDGAYFAFIGSDNKLRCGIDQDVTVDSGAPLPLVDRWQHVACTYDPAGGGTLEVFVDGDVVACRRDVGALEPDLDEPRATTLGVRAGDPEDVFADHYLGHLDNLHLYPVALAPSEICRLAGRTGCNAACPEPPRPFAPH